MSIFEDHHAYHEQTFTDLSVPGEHFTEVDFAHCTFERCVFTECAFARCSFTECHFRGCDLSLATIANARFLDTDFRACKLLGVDWTKIGNTRVAKLLLSVHFDECALNYSSFFGLKLKGSRFATCIAREVDFGDADLTQTNCTGTDFSGSKFLHTNLTRADFRGAMGYAIDPTANTVAKARFSLPDAISLLRGFDVVIE